MDRNPIHDFHHAIANTCDIKEAGLILERGIDINHREYEGLTSLMIAVMPNDYGDHNSIESVMLITKFLIEHGADKSLRDSNGLSALDHASAWTEPNWKDEFGDTAVQFLSAHDLRLLKQLMAILDPNAEHDAAG